MRHGETEANARSLVTGIQDSPLTGVERTGKFRTGTDQLLADDKGQSRISAEDYAIALVDELEQPKHIRGRFTAAY